MEVELQKWHIEKLHKEIKDLESDDSESSRTLRQVFGEIIHNMTFYGMDFYNAKHMVESKYFKEKLL